MKQFKDLPKEIQEEMLLNQARQGNHVNASIFINDPTSRVEVGGFNWDKSPQGGRAWAYAIIVGDYRPFFKWLAKEPITLSEAQVCELVEIGSSSIYTAEDDKAFLSSKGVLDIIKKYEEFKSLRG